MFSISTTPAKQSVSETITVLCGRLNSATLLEDRRAAILGLRSFAKDFPASVASGALRCLIGSLVKDGDDVDTVKVVLETLLLLFNPNVDSPEASDEVFLWLADEFTQRQENITLLLDFVESNDFYPRLYSLQLLSAILSARTERTEECVFTAPLGLNRLVAALDDTRNAIRDECINLLISLTPTSVDVQKLVAFENAFERIFAIIDADGSLAEGGRTVEDCLILLANLLRRNASNQSLFRESGCVGKLAGLLRGLLAAQPSSVDIAAWAHTQRERNVYAFLAVLRLFVVPGSVGVSLNQHVFWKQGIVYDILQLAFSRERGQVAIKAEALTACGDMIRDAKLLQESFAQLMVPAPMLASQPEDTAVEVPARTYVIDGLLDLTLNSGDIAAFDLRYASCECLKAYLSNHTEVRLHFLSRAIDGYLAGAEESANILTVLLRPDLANLARDAYRQWFASVIAFHLLHDNSTAKSKLLKVTEGDASTGEEVVTSFQTATAHLITGITRGDDPRVLVGYLTLLLGWTFEDLDAVNDLLAEGSNVQSLIQAVTQPNVSGGDVVQGLCAMLLGVAYEFSTKDSPLPRTAFHSILLKRLNREQYLDRLTRLRSHPLVRDFEVTPQRYRPSEGSNTPEIFFDAVFVNFFKDNYSRVARSIDRAPELEISIVTNGVQKGISRELVDSLRCQVEDKDRTLEEMKAKMASLEDKIHNREAEHRRSAELAGLELSKLKGSLNDAERVHQERLRDLMQQQAARQADQEREIESMRHQAASIEAQLRQEITRTRDAAQLEVEHVQTRAEAETADLKASIKRLEMDFIKTNESNSLEIQRLREENASLVAIETDKKLKAEARIAELEGELRQMRDQTIEAEKTTHAAGTGPADGSSAKDGVQSELEDLLIAYGDLEEKSAKYKARLQQLGEVVSDVEEDDDNEGQADSEGDDEVD